MKSRKQRPVLVGTSEAGREREVQREIETFLQALSSYPERFACEPYLSFEQHLFRITASCQHTALVLERRKS